MLNVAVEHGAVTAVNSREGLLAGGAELVGHDLIALCDAEFLLRNSGCCDCALLAVGGHAELLAPLEAEAGAYRTEVAGATDGCCQLSVYLQGGQLSKQGTFLRIFLFFLHCLNVYM